MRGICDTPDAEQGLQSAIAPMRWPQVSAGVAKSQVMVEASIARGGARGKSERAEYSEYDDDLGSCKMDSLESLELCAAPSRRAKPSLFGKMSSIFGKSVKAPTPCAAPPRSRTLSAHMERSSLDHAMPCSMERAEHGSYSLAEQDLSAEQGHRLYSKLKSRSKA